MYTNLDRKIDRREDPIDEPSTTIAPAELSVDGFVTQLTQDVELVLRRRAARSRDCAWLR